MGGGGVLAAAADGLARGERRLLRGRAIAFALGGEVDNVGSLDVPLFLRRSWGGLRHVAFFLGGDDNLRGLREGAGLGGGAAGGFAGERAEGLRGLFGRGGAVGLGEELARDLREVVVDVVADVREEGLAQLAALLLVEPVQCWMFRSHANHASLHAKLQRNNPN